MPSTAQRVCFFFISPYVGDSYIRRILCLPKHFAFQQRSLLHATYESYEEDLSLPRRGLDTFATSYCESLSVEYTFAEYAVIAVSLLLP